MGKGICPIIGSILPLVNVEVTEGVLSRLVSIRNIRVFDTITGVQITTRNYKNLVMAREVARCAQVETPIEPVKVSPNQKTAKKKTTKKVVQEAPATVEAVPETPVEVTPIEPVEAETQIEPEQSQLQPETTESEPPTDTPDEEENVTEDSSVETESEATETPTYSSKKKKRR